MTKVSSTVLDEISGKLGKGVVFRQTPHGTVMAKAGRKSRKRSQGQAEVRCRIANASANYRLYAGKLKQAFEGKGTGVSDFNQYVGVNYTNPVYITKTMRVSGCCVLADYTFTVGSLPPISYAVDGSGVLVSQISLGRLVIDEHTTVGAFTQALIVNNVSLEFEDGDQLTFFLGAQSVDAQGMPRANMVAKKVILSEDDDVTTLWSLVGPEGFRLVDGFLGMGSALENGGAAWVHSRDKVSGDTLVSTQKLFVVNEILTYYRSQQAMRASADSYGGINSNRVYLNPKSEENANGVTMPGGGGSQQSGGNGGGGGSSSTGSETGGQAEVVAKPEISGRTPFTDSTTVTIEGPEGASLYYSMDGSTPTSKSTMYTEAFELTDTATVKAIAVIGETSSEVASKTFTKNA